MDLTNDKQCPMSGAERTRLYRQRLKERGLADSYKQKDTKRKAKARKAKEKKMTEQEKEKRRVAERIRKREYRAKLKEQNQQTSTPQRQQIDKSASSSPSYPFSNSSSLGKAVSRVKQSLPRSPHKTVKTLTTIVQNLSPGKRKMFCENLKEPAAKRRLISGENKHRKKRCDALSDAVISKIEAFYQQDDISRMCPGKKEFVSVKTDSGREHKQKRLLQMNLSEAHQIYLSENDKEEFKVGLSKFSSLRPQHVFPITEQNHDVCLCRYHENIEMLLNSLGKVVPMLPIKSEEIVATTLCSVESEDCIDRQCHKCGVFLLDTFFRECDMENEVAYCEWITEDGRTIKNMQQSDLYTAKQVLYDKLEPFARHVYNARRQHSELKYLKKHLKPGHVILHEDFSENYTLKYQREIMQAHWTNASVTLFTAIVYFRKDDNSDLEHISYTVISDELCHDKRAVVAFNKAILNDFLQKVPMQVSMVHYWSDGGGSQFKNKFMFCNLLFHKKDFGFDADWSFFATAHGKGPIDGIGGEVKRTVWRAILQGKIVINDAKEFFNAAQDLCKKIKVLYVDKQKILVDSKHEVERWDKCDGIQGTRELHFVKPLDSHNLGHALNSSFQNIPHKLKISLVLPEFDDCEKENVQENISFRVGDFALVEFPSANKNDTRVFLCQIVCIDDSMYEVSSYRVSNSSKRIFVMPEIQDFSWIMSDQLLEKLPVPVINARGHHIFPKEIDTCQ